MGGLSALAIAIIIAILLIVGYLLFHHFQKKPVEVPETVEDDYRSYFSDDKLREYQDTIRRLQASQEKKPREISVEPTPTLEGVLEKLPGHNDPFGLNQQNNIPYPLYRSGSSYYLQDSSQKISLKNAKINGSSDQKILHGDEITHIPGHVDAIFRAVLYDKNF